MCFLFWCLFNARTRTGIAKFGYFSHRCSTSFHYGAFNCWNGIWGHHSICLTRSRRVCHKAHAVLELSSVFVHLLEYQTSATILPLQWRWNSMIFTLSPPKKMNDRTLLLFGAWLKWGGHFYAGTVASWWPSALCCHMFDILVRSLPTYSIMAQYFEMLLPFEYLHLSHPYMGGSLSTATAVQRRWFCWTVQVRTFRRLKPSER